jgi:hypothetical protein
LIAPIFGMSATPKGGGYWEVASDGGIFSFGDASFYGSMGDKRLYWPVVGIASTPNGFDYWLVAADGGIFNFGNSGVLRLARRTRLNAFVVGRAPTPGGGGYWITGADCGIFNYGDANFCGSRGRPSLPFQRIKAPCVHSISRHRRRTGTLPSQRVAMARAASRRLSRHHAPPSARHPPWLVRAGFGLGLLLRC